MDPLDAIEGLAHQARKEDPPPTDVCDAVLSRLRPAETGVRVLPLALFALASAAAAAVILALALTSSAPAADPLMDLVTPLEVAML